MLVKTGFFGARGLSEKWKNSVCFKLSVKTSFFMRLVKTLEQNLTQILLESFYRILEKNSKNWVFRYITSSLIVSKDSKHFKLSDDSGVRSQESGDWRGGVRGNL
jgi:hypothetical protein